MRTRDIYLDHLAQVPLFSTCSRKDLQKLGKASDEIAVRGGKVLVEEGKRGHEFFLIEDGTAEVRRKNREVAPLGRGQFFGERSLPDRRPRWARVVADTATRLGAPAR